MFDDEQRMRQLPWPDLSIEEWCGLYAVLTGAQIFVGLCGARLKRLRKNSLLGRSGL
jgi:hypothetical protein